ncbi:MAG: hypothetical protein OES47_04840 [Acidobacteriota bacterium]|nr:hypothetical protein [Acidobacteriota bacterium]
MRQAWKRTSTVCLCLVTLAGLVGCRQLSPEEKVEELRSRYTARINEGGFFLRDVPVEPVDPVDSEESQGTISGGAETEGSEFGDVPVEPVTRQELLLDIIVQHDSDETLPGITVDLEMSDASGNVKKRWRKWVETEGLPKANQKQVTETLIDVGYEEGDRFNAEIRSPIPPEERSDYREFAGSGG